MSDLPTKPGPYYWRVSDGGEWEIAQINRCMDIYFVGCDMHYKLRETGGEWLPIPTAEELVELRAAKKMVDDGFEDAYVVTSVSGRSVSIDFTEPRAWSLAERLEGIFRCDLESSGYTCRKVRVCKEVKS